MAGMNVRDDILNTIEKPKPSGRDLAYRAVAAVFGGPVDLTAMVMKPFGYDTEKPVLGSEWIGQKMQDVGLVSEARDPLQEFMASLLVPGGGIEAVPALAGKGMAMLPAAMGVVKAKGGNWLTGSAEEALRPLKKGTQAAAEQATAEIRRIRPDISEEEARRFVNQAPISAADAALNSWVEGPLTKYVKTRMASPDDEIRKLADQGVLHFDAYSPGVPWAKSDERAAAGFPRGNVSETQLGQSWEDQADRAVSPRTAGEQLMAESPYNTETMPWLAQLDPNTPIFNTSGSYGGDLGFRHLTDELYNALNPESGLPRALQLTPDQMKNLSVEKAVRRVADINKWRANQMAEANKAIAFDEKTAPVFKEYQTVPGYGGGKPNEKGLHWREIKNGTDDVTPSEYAAWEREMRDDLGNDTEWDEWVSSHTPDDLRKQAAVYTGEKALEKQLKYEGDTMGHCVGGYCDSVLSGKSQVYTLRDKAGKPHVTIEVRPTSGTVPITAEMRAERSYLPLRATHLNLDTGERAYELIPPGVKIVQIKGAKNSAPKDEYVPFIQDFIRSGNFSDIGDLKNAQMVKASRTFNKTKLEYLKRHGAELKGEEYLTKAEVEALQSLFKPANK